jgi:hypothetical protein
LSDFCTLLCGLSDEAQLEAIREVRLRVGIGLATTTCSGDLSSKIHPRRTVHGPPKTETFSDYLDISLLKLATTQINARKALAEY